MARWSKNTAQVRDNGFGASRGGAKIEGAVLHHGAGLDVLDYVANANNRDSHPTYHVATNGKQTGIVHPDRRPFSTAHSVDRVAIAFEMDNSSVGGNWPVSAKALDTVIETCVDHARQAGLKKFAKNTPGKDQPGVFFIAWHSQYKDTACPGPYVLSEIDWIISECNRRIKGEAPTPAPTPPKPKPSKLVAVPGRESTAKHLVWPTGEEMIRLQRALAGRTKFGERSRYAGQIDGIGGSLTAMGVQTTLNISRKNGVKPYVVTSVDGKLGINNGYGVQHYGKAHGGYRGPIDGDPREFSWAAFCLGLERP